MAKLLKLLAVKFLFLLMGVGDAGLCTFVPERTIQMQCLGKWAAGTAA